MKTSSWLFVVIFVSLLMPGCSRSPASSAAEAASKPGVKDTSGMSKISTLGKAEYADLVVTADGTIHAVFSDAPAYNKPKYIYYRWSKDGGKTWSEPKNLSDDESGNAASCMRLIQDGRGRIYCIWKYVGSSEILDGPGGCARGVIVFRCLEGGNWTNRKLIGDDKVPSYSWFAAVDPKGVVHVVWSQMAKDAFAAHPSAYYTYADLVRQVSLEGGSLGAVKNIIEPKPLLTKEQQEQIKKSGKYPKYEDTVPKQEGLINLRGYVDAAGVAHFVGEDPGITDGPSSQQTGRRIRYWNGQKLGTLYAFEKYKTFNNFNNPPLLAVDATGKEYLIRSPEKSEKPCVRAYPVVDGELGDPVDIIVPTKGPGSIVNWQADMLPGGRISVTAALSEKGGYDPDDLELYLSVSDGKGNWSKPKQLTHNAGKQTGFSKQTIGLNSVGMLTMYRPKYAATVLGKGGQPALAIVNVESSIVGMDSAGVTGTGRTVVVSSGGRVENPYVFFMQQ